MWDFLLVLGQIPGTDIQVTFLEIIGAFILVILAFLARKKLVHSWHKIQLLHLYLHTKKGQQLKLSL